MNAPDVGPGRPDTTGEAAVFEPTDWIRYCEGRSGRTAPSLPRAGVQLLLRSEFARVLDHFGVEPDDFTMAGHPFAVVEAGSRDSFVVAWSAKGSGAAGGLEELIALGVQRIVVVGSAGSLVHHIGVGDVVVATSARRDDGVSHHYEPDAAYSYPSPPLTAALTARLAGRGIDAASGPFWSIDAYFRQTPGRLSMFRSEGCVAVANEAAAAFSVASHRGVEVAAVCVIGDSIADGRFDPAGTIDPATVTAMIESAIDASVGSS